MFNKTNDVRRVQYYNGSILIVRQHNRKLYYADKLNGVTLAKLNRVLRDHFTIESCIIGVHGADIYYKPKVQ